MITVGIVKFISLIVSVISLSYSLGVYFTLKGTYGK